MEMNALEIVASVGIVVVMIVMDQTVIQKYVLLNNTARGIAEVSGVSTVKVSTVSENTVLVSTASVSTALAPTAPVLAAQESSVWDLGALDNTVMVVIAPDRSVTTLTPHTRLLHTSGWSQLSLSQSS